MIKRFNALHLINIKGEAHTVQNMYVNFGGTYRVENIIFNTYQV